MPDDQTQTGQVLNGTTTSIAVDATTNRLAGASYDSNGNMTSGVGATFTFDVGNRVLSAAEMSGGVEYYGYAPDNKRIYKKLTSGAEEYTFYGGWGERLGEYSVTGSTMAALRTNVWFAGMLISENGSAVYQDRVGTNRAGGARFRPYGDEITSTANDREKFATYTRDSYTGVDYAEQRYYASTYGRFNSPDPYMAAAEGANDPGAPQSWNRYAYVTGDPVNFRDPRGLFECTDCDEPEPGPDPGPQRPGPPPPPTAQQVYDRNLTQLTRSKLKTRINHLGNCTKILGGGTTADLLDVANQIQYFNGSSDAPGSGRTQQAVSNNGSYTTLAATVSGSVVASTLTWQGHPIGDVVLGTDFFQDPTVSQPDVLLHEALHFALGLGGAVDVDLKTWLAQYGFKPQQYGTDDITQWLKANCPDQNK